MRKNLQSILAIIICILVGMPRTYSLDISQINDDVQIISVQNKNYLERIEEETIYTGITKQNKYQNFPQKGYQYLLVELNTKLEEDTQLYDKNNFDVYIEDKKYKVVQEDQFLNEYNIQTLEKDGLILKGTLVFEIPNSLLKEQISKGYLVNEKLGIKVKLQDNMKSNISYKDNIVDKQFKKEQEILQQYYTQFYTINKPYVVLNPYDIAPLTALVMFETKEAVKVSVKIHGKDENTDISYNFNEYNTHHEIPIIGLYAGQNNTITIQIQGKQGQVFSKQINIQTQPLPDYMIQKNIKTTIKDSNKMQEGLIFVVDNNRTIVDMNGDIRWFTTILTSASGIEEFLENGHILIPVDNHYKWSGMYEIDWLGKVYWAFTDGINMHHDAEEMDNGNILFYASGKLFEVDKETGKIVKSKHMVDIMPYREEAEIRAKGSGDWFHENTIVYDRGDIIVSGRNQHIVVKEDYESGEIKWILSPNKGYEEYADKYLEPIGEHFEWFYSQHKPSILPDLDNNQDTVDLLLFDNGVHRALIEEEAIQPKDAYSRIVHYRINEKDMTVEQIWEFGKEKGKDFFAAIHSGAQYLEKNGNYLGTFDAYSQTFSIGWEHYFNYPQTSKIVEVTPAGEVVFQVEFSDYTYRSYKIDVDSFSRGYKKLGKEKGEFLLESEVKPFFVNMDQVIKGQVQSDIASISYNDEYLDIEGWAYIQGMEEANPEMYLQLQNGINTYTYVLNRDNRISIPNVKDKKGFKEPYLSIRDLAEGKYTMNLILKEGNNGYSQELPYYFTVEKDEKIQVQQSNMMLEQEKKNQEINKELIGGKYTVQNPLVVQDPYNISPLTAIIAFNTDKPSKVKVEVQGKKSSQTIIHEFDNFEKQHVVPIYGLYADYTNNVTITVTDEQGNVIKQTVEIVTGKLPQDMVNVQNVVQKDITSDQLMFMASSYLIAVDNTGEIRWYISDKTMGGGATPIQRLDNGNIVVLSNRNVRPMYYQTGAYEMDLLGRVYNEYIVQGAHHEIQELSNGNLLIAAEKDDQTTEDYIVELDRQNGNVVRSWDLGEILGIEEISDITYQNQTYKENLQNNSKQIAQQIAKETHEHDWLHNNAFDYIEEENTMIVSSRHQDMVFKFDVSTGEVIWILADTNDKYPEYLQDKLLKPIGDDFEWQYGQHAVEQLPNGQIMVYDNGNFRSKDVDTALNPNDNYSRAVIYTIDTEQMTVEQVWQYGKERGNELYTPYIGDVDYIGENHYVINFGGIIRDEEGNRYDSPSALFAKDDTKGEAVVVELKDNEVVSELKVTAPKNANTYRVEKMPLYTQSETYVDLSLKSNRKGDLRKSTAINKKLPLPTALAYEIKEIKDEGDRVLVNLQVFAAEQGEKIYVVLSNQDNEYVYETQNDTNTIKKYINKVGIQKGEYNIGILVENKEHTYYAQTNYQINIR